MYALSTKLYAATKKSVKITTSPLPVADRMESLQLAELLADIDIALDAGELERAVGLIDANLRTLPNPGPLQIRLADSAVAMDRPERALPVYRRAVRHLARRGFPAESLTALVKLRETTESLLDDPANSDEASLVEEATAEWTELYSRESKRLDPDARIHPLPGNDAITLEPAPVETSPERRLTEMIDQSGDQPPADTPAEHLPGMPLLSDLPAEVVRRICEALTHERYDAIEPIFADDFPDGSLVWTVTPNVTLGDESPEHRLQPGTLLGLNAVGITPREPGHRAFTRKGTELLRWPESERSNLTDAINGLDPFVGQFHRQAVVERLMATHPMFETVELDRRSELLDLLEPVSVSADTTVVEQGEPSVGIFVVVDGEVDIVRTGDDWTATLATLGPGGLFGEIGVVSDRDPVATVRMNTDGYLLMLPARRFAQAAGNFPRLAKYAVNKARSRIKDIESTLDATEVTELDP